MDYRKLVEQILSDGRLYDDPKKSRKPQSPTIRQEEQASLESQLDKLLRGNRSNATEFESVMQRIWERGSLTTKKWRSLYQSIFGEQPRAKAIIDPRPIYLELVTRGLSNIRDVGDFTGRGRPVPGSEIDTAQLTDKSARQLRKSISISKRA